MSRRDQVVVAADGTISVEEVDTFDEPQVTAAGRLTVGTREAPEVDRLSSDGFTLTTGVAPPWMWLTGKLNVEGRVENSRSFNSEPWMWAAGTLGVGGYVDNTRAF